IHKTLKESCPEILTIIVPRHPERGPDIAAICEAAGLDCVLRRDIKRLPDNDTDIYIANTLGELGLFYSLAPIACIGRSFSDDGGGGHNPIEAAQLNCAVLHGPHVQNLQDIFDDMDATGAAITIPSKKEFAPQLLALLNSSNLQDHYQQKALEFAASKTRVIDTVMQELQPLLTKVITK
ncbi:MAG: 3-deoxy-D-manno-octulosonic acid transferase, partial [Alphaproteobacteria bacterium]